MPASPFLKILAPSPLAHAKVLSFTSEEGLSSPFRHTVELAGLEPAADFEAFAGELIGKPVVVGLRLESGGYRPFHGVVRRLSRTPGEEQPRHHLVLGSWLEGLDHYADCRVFQDQTVQEIVGGMFEQLGATDVAWRLMRTDYEPRPYTVQYRETTLSFILRLLADEGIWFYFEHEAEKHILVLGDDPALHTDFGPPVWDWQSGQPDEGEHRDVGGISAWSEELALAPGTFSVSSYDPMSPSTPPVGRREIEDPSRPGAIRDYEPRFYEPEQGERVATRLLEVETADRITIRGRGRCRAMASGRCFTLLSRGHVVPRLLVRSVVHTAASRDRLYGNTFRCQPAAAAFRPRALTPKPVVQGPQTAIVVGSEGGADEVHVDDHGRVRVRFPWMRGDNAAQTSSCWLRVSQGVAGSGWGTQSIPRVGTEVLVAFLSGDPDRPIIVGALHNGEQPSPYPAKAYRTRFAFRSRSSPGGDDGSEVGIEDEDGEERVYVHSKRDLEIQVAADTKTKVEADANVVVGGDARRKTAGSVSSDTGKSSKHKVGKDLVVEAGGTIRIRAATKLVIEGVEELALVGPGGAFISLAASGIVIEGKTVKVNGGAAAPDTGKRLELPDPIEPRELRDRAGELIEDIKDVMGVD